MFTFDVKKCSLNPKHLSAVPTISITYLPACQTKNVLLARDSCQAVCRYGHTELLFDLLPVSIFNPKTRSVSSNLCTWRVVRLQNPPIMPVDSLTRWRAQILAEHSSKGAKSCPDRRFSYNASACSHSSVCKAMCSQDVVIWIGTFTVRYWFVPEIKLSFVWSHFESHADIQSNMTTMLKEVS